MQSDSRILVYSLAFDEDFAQSERERGGRQFLDSAILFVSMDAEIRNNKESYDTEAEPSNTPDDPGFSPFCEFL